MDIFESKYWKLTVILQKWIGFYFFQKLWKNYISWIYVYSFTLSFMISMGVRLYNEMGVNINIVVENIVGELYLFLVFSKITGSVIHKNQFKEFYVQIANDWKIMKNDEELKIMHHFTEIGRKSILLYSAYMLVAIGLFLALPITTPFMDLVFPLENGSRPKALPYYAEYGIDQEKYYYPLMAQAIFGGVGTAAVLVTFDLAFILTVQHVVALFAIVEYRLLKTSKISEGIEKGTVDFSKEEARAYRQIVAAIQLHQTVIKYVDIIENSYHITWFIVLMINMIFIGAGLAIILLKIDQPEECLRYVIVLIAGFIHFYYIFLPGQKIINCSSKTLEKCYACKWYNLSRRSKTLIKIMMIRSMRTCELTGGKMFVLCMDTYCSMMKTGFSIFTLLR